MKHSSVLAEKGRNAKAYEEYCSRLGNTDDWNQAIEVVKNAKSELTLATAIREVRRYVACGYDSYTNLKAGVSGLDVRDLVTRRVKEFRGSCLNYWNTQLECAFIATQHDPKLSARTMKSTPRSKLDGDCPKLELYQRKTSTLRQIHQSIKEGRSPTESTGQSADEGPHHLSE